MDNLRDAMKLIENEISRYEYIIGRAKINIQHNKERRIQDKKIIDSVDKKYVKFYVLPLCRISRLLLHKILQREIVEYTFWLKSREFMKGVIMDDGYSEDAKGLLLSLRYIRRIIPAYITKIYVYVYTNIYYRVVGAYSKVFCKKVIPDYAKALEGRS